MFRTILIANRGEIAVRVARACRELGIRSVAVHSTADAGSAPTRCADESVHIGPPPSRRSYLHIPNVIEAALQCGADAVHPGYGFLSEDPDFAEICAENGLTFIGPDPPVMRRAADKSATRAAMAAAGLPVLPGSDGPVADLAEARALAAGIGYPVVLKATAGGGGRGIAMVPEESALAAAYRETSAAALSLFGDGSLYLERYVPVARHVEVQVVRDRYGDTVHLGERDCSLQRRRQKLVEEAPSAALTERQRADLCRYAVQGADSIDYLGVGTMEFLLDDAGRLAFLELNCRIQVEHPVTEMLTGIDLVREQILVAAGHPLSFRQQDVVPRGAAIECRVNAEDPRRAFRPTPGRLTEFDPPGGPFTRVDSGFAQGDTAPAYYDSLLAKVVVWAPTRDQAVARMDRALAEFRVAGDGIATTIPLVRALIDSPGFRAAEHTTTFVDDQLAAAVEGAA